MMIRDRINPEKKGAAPQVPPKSGVHRLAPQAEGLAPPAGASKPTVPQLSTQVSALVDALATAAPAPAAPQAVPAAAQPQQPAQQVPPLSKPRASRKRKAPDLEAELRERVAAAPAPDNAQPPPQFVAGKALEIPGPMVHTIAGPQARAAKPKKESMLKHFVPEIVALGGSIAVTAGLVLLPQSKELLDYARQHMGYAREVSDGGLALALVGAFQAVTAGLALWAMGVKAQAFHALAPAAPKAPVARADKPKAD